MRGDENTVSGGKVEVVKQYKSKVVTHNTADQSLANVATEMVNLRLMENHTKKELADGSGYKMIPMLRELNGEEIRSEDWIAREVNKYLCTKHGRVERCGCISQEDFMSISGKTSYCHHHDENDLCNAVSGFNLGAWRALTLPTHAVKVKIRHAKHGMIELENITEIHYGFTSALRSIAFESDIESTGCTYLIEDILEFEAVLQESGKR